MTDARECRVPFCHREQWGKLRSCKKHTLYSRQAMQLRRDRKKVVLLALLETRIAALLLDHRFDRIDAMARAVIKLVVAHMGRTRRKRNG